MVWEERPVGWLAWEDEQPVGVVGWAVRGVWRRNWGSRNGPRRSPMLPHGILGRDDALPYARSPSS